MNCRKWVAVLLMLCLASSAGAQSVFIGNETIGLHVTSYGSVVGGAMEYPPATLQGYLEAYWVRYGGASYHSEWPLEAPGAIMVTEIEPMHYTVDRPDEIEAVGRATAGQIEATTVAYAAQGHNWIRLLYTLTNTGDQPAENVRFFQFADVDVGPAGIGGAEPENADDTARFVADLNTVYTTDNILDPATEPPGLAIGIMSPLPPSHHDVYGGPNPDFDLPYANPAYDNLYADMLDDSRIEFTGDAGMTMEWDFGTLLPGESVSVPVYFFGVLEENDIPDIFDEVGVIPMAIDIKPGSDVNPINLKARGVLPVAILSNEELDANMVDPGTVLLGDPAVEARVPPLRAVLEDVNRDGRPDLMMHFGMPALVAAGAIRADSTALELTAKTHHDVELRGEDTVRLVGGQ